MLYGNMYFPFNGGAETLNVTSELISLNVMFVLLSMMFFFF